MLLHFLEPDKFASQEEFEAEFSDLGSEGKVTMSGGCCVTWSRMQ
jgi:hypothetical protein